MSALPIRFIAPADLPSLVQATSPAPVRALEEVRRQCELRVRAHSAAGLPASTLSGQLIRPLVSLAGAVSEPDERLWDAALAVQYAHEASLLHDDVIDQAVRRRGTATVVAARGVAAALVEGDHLLTAAYRLASATGSLAFASLFARAVERTVAGERLQGARRGRELSLAEYRQVVSGKSGELLGAALAAGPTLAGDVRAERFRALGVEVGVCYQMVDDLLDYCPAAQTGKNALGDYAQRIWTWPLSFLSQLDWEQDAGHVLRALATRGAGPAPLERALGALRSAIDATAAEVRALLPSDVIVISLLCEWLGRAERAVTATLAEFAGSSSPAERPGALQPTVAATDSEHAPMAGPPVALPADRELAGFFARNSGSFSFAARLFPRRERARVTDVYAFCRVTDDLADDASLPGTVRAERLEAWIELCRRSYRGEASGVPVLDRVLSEAARSDVPFRYMEELVAGMRMDLAHRRYQSLADLRVYTHRVASVVGLWLARLWGVSDERVLEGAASLGHAMQLTNILRDVGEDFALGRIYLPLDLLDRYQVGESLIAALAAGGSVPARWRALTEELMAVADAHYHRAFHAMQSLPPAVRAPVAVAASVYRGIHDEIRRNGYDNVTRRARTSRLRKVWLTGAGLWRLWRASASAERPRRQRVARTLGTGVVATLALALAFAAVVQAQTPGAPGPVAAWSAAQHVPAAPGPNASPSNAPDTHHAIVAGIDSLLELDRLRWLYRAGVDEQSAVEEAAAALAAIETSYQGLARDRAALLDAYRGAIRLLRAKHGSWPVSRVRHARAGLRLLDDAVRAAPADAEVRYLRLLSCYHLPGIFGRGDTVRADFAALAAALPFAGVPHSRGLDLEMVEFLLAYAPLDPASRARLEQWRIDHG